jgi:hypothetical protein
VNVSFKPKAVLVPLRCKGPRSGCLGRGGTARTVHLTSGVSGFLRASFGTV